MNLLKSYIQNFLKRSGSYIFTATIFARIFSFFASWLALKLIANEALGNVLFAYNFILFIIPICGLGLHQSLIRYGALLTSKEEKNNLFLYVFKKGILASILLIFLIIIGSYFINFQFNNTRFYVIVLSFILLPSFVLEIIRAQFRLNYNNKSFAFTEIIHSIILVILVYLLSYLYQETGYAFALILTPLLTSLFFIKRLNINYKLRTKLEITNFKFWKYGFFASLSNVVTQLLFVIDILLIGYLLNDTTMVTNYRYISLIPFSLLFLPRVFINTDFVSFTENIYNKNYIKKYIKSYMLLFSIVSIILLFISWFFADIILTILDDTFIEYSSTFLVLMVGITGIFILRGLFGNLLSSIGKAHINYYIASLALVFNVIANYYLIPKYDILGAAITSALLMWFTGILSAIWFYSLYKKQLLLKKAN